MRSQLPTEPQTDWQRFLGQCRELYDRSLRFGRDFAGGVSRRDVERLFQEDATHVFQVLAADRKVEDESGDDLARFLRGIRAFFLGLVFKLSPARRMLFVISLLLPVLGMIDVDLQLSATSLYVDFSPIWFGLGMAGMVFLLALELVDRVRVRDELEVARALQRDLLPTRAPELSGWSIAHSYRTANEIGGDYYDFLELEDGRLALAVGDASGHGIGAGLVMAIACAMLKTAVDTAPSPHHVLEMVNRAIYRTGGRRAFLTLFYGVLDPATGRLEYACAGHPFPLLRRAEGDVVELGHGALPLGLRREVEVATGETQISEGETLVLYTDGLPEAVSGDGETESAFGFERLKGLTRHGGSPRDIHDRVIAALDHHLDESALDDDVTLVVISRKFRPPPLPTA